MLSFFCKNPSSRHQNGEFTQCLWLFFILQVIMRLGILWKGVGNIDKETIK